MLFNNSDKSLKIYQTMVAMSHESFVLTNTENLFNEHFPHPSSENEDTAAIVDFISLAMELATMITIVTPFTELLDLMNNESEKIVDINNEYHDLSPLYKDGNVLVSNILSLMKEKSHDFSLKIKQYNISSESTILKRYVKENQRTEAPITCVSLLRNLLRRSVEMLMQLNKQTVTLIENPNNDEELEKFNQFVTTVRASRYICLSMLHKNYQELASFLK